MHISAVLPVSQAVLIFGVMDHHTEFLNPSCLGPIHLKNTAKKNCVQLLTFHVLVEDTITGK